MYVIVYLYLLHCLISYPSPRYMYISQFMWKHIVRVHVYSAFHVFPLDTLLLYNHNIIVWLFCVLHVYMFILIIISLCYI